MNHPNESICRNESFICFSSAVTMSDFHYTVIVPDEIHDSGIIVIRIPLGNKIKFKNLEFLCALFSLGGNKSHSEYEYCVTIVKSLRYHDMRGMNTIS